jgi:hypothetical protein
MREAGGGVSPLLLFLLLGGACAAILVVFGRVEVPPPSHPIREATARVRVVITDASYHYGHLVLGGTVENVGDADAPGLTIRIRIRKGDTLLAEDTTGPAATMLHTLPPGSTAAFQAITRVPGEPSSVSYEVSVDRVAYDVRYEVLE